jgi:cytochrome P450
LYPTDESVRQIALEMLAIPLPGTVIADLLGVPNKDWKLIKTWSDILFLHLSGVASRFVTRPQGG